MKATKKVIIKTEENKYVERFYGASVLETSNINLAGKYNRKDAQKKLDKWNLKYELIESN